MMGIEEMLRWWNLIYLAPLVLSLVWILAAVVSGVHGGDVASAGHGAENALDHDVTGIEHAVHGAAHGLEHALHDLGHAVGMHGHAEPGAAHAEAHAEAGHDHAAHGEQGDDLMARLMMLLGIGRVPISLVIGVFLLCWGAFGMVMNSFLSQTIRIPAAYIWPSMGITFLISAFVTRLMSAVVGRVMPADETYGVSRTGLVGVEGKAVYVVTETSGTIDIKDKYGTLHRVQAKTEPEAEPLPAGTQVFPIYFDEHDKRYIVRRSTF